MLTNCTLVMLKNTNAQCNTYTNLPLAFSYSLTQVIYGRTKSPQKGIFLFHKAWNMPVLFSICFYQIHIINMTNDCVSITKTLMIGVKLMTEKHKKYIKSKGQSKDK